MTVDPILMTLMSLAVLAGVVLLRWVAAKPWWPLHPGGSRGYLRDVATVWSPLLMLLAAGLAYRVLIGNDPAASGQPIYLGLFVVAYLGVIVARRVGPVRQAQLSLEAARPVSAGEVRKEAV
ncbi:hypothetical protein [Caulobacter sp. 17J65-9]|uniref:hypothetical protein n=1 Tax=Caulobacter sp. 17J65-9 TaxID=2709382 RepID=UPI0013CD43AB|nr:hypothetical protein [Caulobacter sp. 17J65-9]NEX93793.1 hypothetical protein [Caulobacter sp. 17J65-9]